MAAVTTRILHTNLVDTASVITGSSAATNFPDDNLQDEFVAVPWRTTGDSDENVVIDMGSAKQVTFCGIFGHNFTSGATVTLQANAADSWGAPSYTQALTIVSDSLSQVIPKIGFFLDQTYRYWRLRIQDSSNSDTYVEVGRFWLGTYVSPTYNFNNGFTANIVKPDIVSRARFGGVYGASYPSYEQLSFGWQSGSNPLSTSDRLLLEAIYRTKGMTTPIVIVYDALNNPSLSALYGNFEMSQLQRTHGIVDLHGLEGFSFREDVGWNGV